jgi:RNA-directed DNA polymerase
MPGLPISTATTRAAIAAAISGSAQLLYSPEDPAACPPDPAHRTKGLLGHGHRPEYAQPAPSGRPEGGSLFDEIADFESLYRAYLRARAGKRDRLSTARFSADLESSLIQIQNHLLWGTWRPGEYESFEVTEPKRRRIYAPAFADRVVHHSIHAALSPVCESVFHPQSFACRPGKGTHRGADCAQRLVIEQLHQGDCYALKGDIAKYFESIDHEVLKHFLRGYISCPRTLRLCDLIIDTSPCAPGVGIPLGNLTSQLFANIYLHELDHYISEVLGVSTYVRYMDDWVVIDGDKGRLREVLGAARAFLERELRLTLNSKTQIFPIRPGAGRALDFLGYRIYADHRRLRRRSVRKGFARARDYARDPNPHNLDRLTSWYAHARHAEPTGMMRRLFAELAT